MQAEAVEDAVTADARCPGEAAVPAGAATERTTAASVGGVANDEAGVG